MNYLVIGGGISGLGAAKLLHRENHTITLYDSQALTPEKKTPWAELGVRIFEGTNPLDVLTGIDHVVLSPSVSADNLLLKAAKWRGIPYCTEIDLALSRFEGKVIAITGTNGKSTTTAMIAHVLSRAGINARAAGNIGITPSEILAGGEAPDCFVLELSSYQLEFSELIEPEVSIFTSFSFDHMGRHGSLEAYFKAKWKLVQKTKPNGLTLLTREVQPFADQYECFSLPCRKMILGLARDDAQTPVGASSVSFTREGVLSSSLEEIAKIDVSKMSEVHNILNASFALLTAAHYLDQPVRGLVRHLDGFRGLPFRCEKIGKLGDYEIINDSKATNVESTIVALESQRRPVILLLGGRGKGESFEPITRFQDTITIVVAFGESGPKIHEELSPRMATLLYPTLAEAVTELPAIFAQRPSPILFSPGCASFDEFRNFEDRGNFFTNSLTRIMENYHEAGIS